MTARSESVMDGTITEQELAQHLTETLDRVRLRGEQLTINRAGEPIAVLSPVGQPVTWRTVAERLAEIGFPGDGFADDVEVAQAAQPRLEPPAWPS
jgi:prevent-host-death family protein